MIRRKPVNVRRISRYRLQCAPQTVWRELRRRQHLGQVLPDIDQTG
jgi:hypothetical protein